MSVVLSLRNAAMVHILLVSILSRALCERLFVTVNRLIRSFFDTANKTICKLCSCVRQLPVHSKWSEAVD